MFLKFPRGGGRLILIPDYLCDYNTKTIVDSGVKYSFYNIEDRLTVTDVNNLELDRCDAILLINYFGLLNLNEIINQIRERKSSIIIIEDDVQAFYKYKESIADYSFTSLRKWFPCPEGAFVKSKNTVESISTYKSLFGQYKIAGNLLKSYGEIIDDSICLELLERGESLLDNEYLTECSHTSEIIFSNIDLKKVADIRKRNAKLLHEGLEELGIEHLYKEDAVPLFVPIFVEDRKKLRNLFFKNHIFTPIHWPVTSEDLNGANSIYDRELSLICDQRYNEEDIKKQLEIIRQFVYREGEKHGGNDS